MIAASGRTAREAARISTEDRAGVVAGQLHGLRGAEPGVAGAPGTPQPQTESFGTPDSMGRYTIDLTGLTVPTGFVIRGDAAGDQAGYSVSSAGDVNNDGYDDFLVGARFGDDGGIDAGEAYLIFGKASGFANIDLTSLAPADGIVIRGDLTGDWAGTSTSSPGDINNDGYDDIVVGAPEGDDGGSRAGEAYVIFGKASGFANIDLTTLAPADGFVIRGDTTNAQAGTSVALADLNGDGFDEIVVGAPGQGRSYVLFGKNTAYGGPDGTGRNFVDLTGLSASDGFTIIVGGSHIVASAGDINNDGEEDLIIGRSDTSEGVAYVIFGKQSGLATIDVATMTLADGFSILGDAAGDRAGFSVSSTGDINNDGYDDIIVGAPDGDDGGARAGEAYVIFGKVSGFANIDLTTLAPADGFVIQGHVTLDLTGRAVSSAGDVNGDGYADIIVGTEGDGGGVDAGEAAILFGGAGGFGMLDGSGRNVIDLSTLATRQGFIIRGDAVGDRAGLGVASAGDINNDGYDDMLVGAIHGNDGGANAGEAYLIFGQAFALPGPNEPTEGIDNLTGTPGNDVIDALGGNDAIDALGGNDEIEGGAGADRMTGGTGDDIYYVDNPGDDVVEAVGEGDDTVRTSVTYTLASGLEIETLAARDPALTTALDLTGNAFAQEITGNAGANALVGGGGVDTLRGLGGDDTYIPDADDIIVEAAGQGFDQVYVSVPYILAPGLSIEVLVGSNITGNEIGQQLIGNSGANTLDGGGGADGLYGLAGDDSYVVSSDDAIIENDNQGFDRLTATTSYTLAAGVSVEMMSAADNGAAINLTGNELNQQLTGNGAANILNGGTGTDTLSGLGGDDLYSINSSDDVIIEAAGQGFDQAYVFVDYTLAAGVAVEVLAVYSQGVVASYRLTGNEFGQQIFGNNGANVIIGGGGTDSMLGFAGDDIYFLDGGDTVFEAVGAGFDQVITSADHVLGAGAAVEVLAVNDSTTTTSVNLTGNEFGQQISGNAGANILVAGGGADGLYGLGGDDIYSVDGQDAVIESAGQGFDQVYSSTSFVLGAGAEVEVLAADTPTGTTALNLVGNEFGQQIFGNSGVNFLDGGGAGDALYGRGGADTFGFTTALGSGNVDAIADFSAADDNIALENAVFTGLPAGALSANAFRVGAAAADADDRIVYNQATGQLFFDADGIGGAAQVQFATLDGAPVITASDFIVI